MGALRFFILLISLSLSGCVVAYVSSFHLPKSPTPKKSDPKKKRGPIELICDEKCTSTEAKKLIEVEQKLNDTLMGKCLQDWILSPDRAFNMLDTTAIEMLTKMREPTILLVNYYSSPDVFTLGYEVAGEPVIHLNRVSMALYGFDLCGEASVAIHEAAHAKGYMHRGNSPDSYNQNTVPYMLNRAFDEGRENGACCI